MKFSKLIPFLCLTSLFFTSCKQQQGARLPISQTSGSFMKKSISLNKKIVANEETQIANLIKANQKKSYISSSKGYWYTYETKNQLDSLTPKKGDVAFFEYEIKDMRGAVIYSKQELKPQTYSIDKQDILMGLRDGIKLMRKKETVTFLFPSHMAYGFHGDNKKIGTNQPIQCTVTLQNFLSEAALKKENEIRLATPETVQHDIKDTLKPKTIKN